MAGFVIDWTRQYGPGKEGQQQVVVLPGSTGEVQAVIKYCNEHSLSVIPQGGNTGLVGGAAGVHGGGEGGGRGEVILSLSRMNRVLSVDAEAAVLVCEAGCVLQQLNAALERLDLAMPVDLGSKGQCQIGGNIATNAGGLHVLRNGPLSAHLLGLEVVTGDGQLLDMLRRHRKDNMGLHTPLMFVGR